MQATNKKRQTKLILHNVNYGTQQTPRLNPPLFYAVILSFSGNIFNKEKIVLNMAAVMVLVRAVPRNVQPRSR